MLLQPAITSRQFTRQHVFQPVDFFFLKIDTIQSPDNYSSCLFSQIKRDPILYFLDYKNTELFPEKVRRVLEGHEWSPFSKAPLFKGSNFPPLIPFGYGQKDPYKSFFSKLFIFKSGSNQWENMPCV